MGQRFGQARIGCGFTAKLLDGCGSLDFVFQSEGDQGFIVALLGNRFVSVVGHAAELVVTEKCRILAVNFEFQIPVLDVYCPALDAADVLISLHMCRAIKVERPCAIGVSRGSDRERELQVFAVPRCAFFCSGLALAANHSLFEEWLGDRPREAS